MNPPVLTRLHQALLDLRASANERRRWQGHTASRGAPAVFYGYDRLPGPGDLAFGGLVKCLDLDRRFPNTRAGANILYLVSSALPPGAVAMARLARRKGVALIYNQNGVAYPAWHGPGWEWSNRPMKALLHMADQVVYQSDFCKASADRFLGRRAGPSVVLHNPVDTSVFVPADRPASPLRLLLAGSHQHPYRVMTALQALATLSVPLADARLTVAGRFAWGQAAAAARAEAEVEARRLGVLERVDFHGPYTQEEAVPLFQRHHILLHTKYADPCPRLVVEAMSCGLPVVYSASGGMGELVGSDAGVGIPAPVDYEKDHPPAAGPFADATLRVAARLPQFSAAARSRAVSRFDVRPWLDRHGELFGKVLGVQTS